MTHRAAVLAGLGAWLPPRVVTNDDLARELDTSDEWIYSRTGIRRRHVADAGMATSDLAVEAGRRALKSADVDRVDTVILATTTPDRPCPATAPDVAARLHLVGATAFDVAAVCTGFVYGLAVASGLIAAGTAERALVIGAETYSTILNPRDRATRALFGDGAGAVVLRAGEPDEPGAFAAFDLGSDGRHSDLIAIPAGGSRHRSSGRPVADGEEYFTMHGREVYRHAVTRMTESATRVLARVGWQVGDVDRFVGHQANRRILTAVADRLGIPDERCVVNIHRVANTAAASIPLALADAAADRTLRAGDRILITAFGGGLAWGATTLCWPDVTPT
jgi:3-oxoacyl-[acyl-carrier-protein] synthase-3